MGDENVLIVAGPQFVRSRHEGKSSRPLTTSRARDIHERDLRRLAGEAARAPGAAARQAQHNANMELAEKYGPQGGQVLPPPVVGTEGDEIPTLPVDPPQDGPPGGGDPSPPTEPSGILAPGPEGDKE